jgi:hypothetical protein
MQPWFPYARSYGGMAADFRHDVINAVVEIIQQGGGYQGG